VLAALDAVNKEIITVTNETYINAESVCIQNIMKSFQILNRLLIIVSHIPYLSISS
jgi:peptidyl-tRNA hydrolase